VTPEREDAAQAPDLWVSETLSLLDEIEAERAVKRIAHVIYGTPFGVHDTPDIEGYSYPCGFLHSANDYAAAAYQQVRA
jgi:hypothetical protein